MVVSRFGLGGVWIWVLGVGSGLRGCLEMGFGEKIEGLRKE